MEFKKITKIEQGKYITRYNITYETEDKRLKNYEMVSRVSDIKDCKDLSKKRADGVILIMHDESGEKILLNKEFRMAVGEWIYNFPAGLIDDGELLEIAAARELWEETGLHIDEIEEILGESYSAVGLTNEKTVCLIGKASGDFKASTSTMEEIEAGWFTKKDVQNLLKNNERFASRTQLYCYLWSKG